MTVPDQHASEKRERRNNLLWQAGRIYDIGNCLSTVKANLGPGNEGRAIAVAVTHIETAVLWLRRAAELMDSDPAQDLPSLSGNEPL